MIDLLLRSASTQDKPGPIDIAVDAGRILEIGPSLDYVSRQEADLGGRLVIPGFVESHLHLDIALMNDWDHAGRQEPFVLPHDLERGLNRRRLEFTDEDIQLRAGAALELASRNGVTALRAQCHVDPQVGLKHLVALLKVKEKYAGRIDLQIVTFPHQGLVRHKGISELFREAFRMGADVMGCASQIIDLPGSIELAFSIAMENGVDLDVHADSAMADSVALEDLDIVKLARLTMRHGYQGRVAAGHVCKLGSATPEVAEEAIALLREAEISVISQPDLHRMGRQDTRNTRRGMTRVKDLLRGGVNVAYASNNVRDAVRPLGNCDLLEEALILAYAGHMDTIEELDTLLKMSTYNAAKALRLPDYGLAPGCAADLVVLDASSPSSAIVGQVDKLMVFKSGRLMAADGSQQRFHGTELTRLRRPC